ncbi:PREDICTED: eukaryotic translation initiation factor 5 [Bactrocera latifrons]|uniref:Eukaryotic translation initiation factor 5 n=3 Tax=Bactrocera latifrons TaxID=174628 RepID=A0A0K8VE40_BACLA|nr:PREDICTED: eukaryotic translation initiation factor 5 [Bactrocera latifrons]XP_018782812.1 PREDICTED: eukaryotic translation initiation factor 5 [Bactrocera latifrons]XP_018782814.1 PREDICTED: eukaryotic translation initiation factor 5 [Bactrocera latifrons]
MGSVNVNRNVTDIFYRYKMPRLQAKVEGKGNGIKTVIVNMAEVARAIGRPATYPTKYFGCELGAQTQFDYKNERFIVNGSHDASKLQDLLDGFIRKFVLCPECDNPETDLTVSAKNQTISQACKACGFHGLLKVNHKVNTFILKNPPTVNPAAQGSSLTEGKRSKRGQKKNGENGVDGDKGASNSGGESDGGSGNQASQTEAEISAAIPEKNGDDDDDDANWSVDVSKEAIRARLQDLTDGAKGMTISDDYDKTEKERIDIFYELVKKKRNAGELDSVAVHKELMIEAERLDIVHKATLVLAELLFSDNITQEVRKNRNLLLRFTHNNPKAQRYLIGGLEQIIALHAAKLMPKVAGIFKLFYDSDILEEKSILEWSQKVSKKYVSKDLATEIHEKVKPFIQWLKEAEEEESSEEDEDDSDVEIEYNDRARVEPLKAAAVATAAKKIVEDDDEGDEIDIDDI